MRVTDRPTPEEIRDLITASGRSNAEVAELVGVTPRAVQMWAAGERQIRPATWDTLRDRLSVVPPLDAGSWDWTSWRDRCHQCAVDHGWHEEPREDAEALMLVVSEMSEAVEAYRDHGMASLYKCRKCGDVHGPGRCPACGATPSGRDKPEGVASELADVVVRLLDLAGLKGWSVETIPPPVCLGTAHAPAEGFVGDCWRVLEEVMTHLPYRTTGGTMVQWVVHVLNLAWHHGLDLSTAINMKHHYNLTRPHRHGGKRA
jgi:rubrerythrin